MTLTTRFRVVLIDIGGGHSPATCYVNLDPAHGIGEWKRRIQDGIPVADCTVEGVRASHVLEHIPAGHERIDVMNEVHRVLVPGGTFEIIVPLFPSWMAVADPTHVSYWCRASFEYFTGGLVAQADYGIRYWRWSDTEPWEETYEGGVGRAVLVKP